MKINAVFLVALIWLVSFSFIARAQDNTLGEALDTEGLNWVVTAGELPDALIPIVPVEENFWHSVTDVTHDGVDALHIVTPLQNHFFGNLIADTEGPIRISFWSKTSGFESTDYFQFFGTRLNNGTNWTQTVITIREKIPLNLKFSIQKGSIGSNEAWLDELEIIRVFPPDITDLPEYFPVTLGKDSKLEIEAEGVGTISYKWFRDGEEIPGETNAEILIPAASEAGQFDYQVEVTDELGSTLSNSSLVEFYNLSDVLENASLEFFIRDLQTQNYSNVRLVGEDAPDGEDAISLRFVRNSQSTQTWIQEISTIIEGPVWVSFKGGAEVHVNGEKSTTEVLIEEDNLITEYFSIIDSGPHIVEWSTPIGGLGNVFGSSRKLDQVKLTESLEPVIVQEPGKHTIVVGNDPTLDYDFVNAGLTIHQLLKDGQVILETANRQITLESLGIGDNGIYQLKLINSLGETPPSAPFEIEFFHTIGDAVEQPSLQWAYEGVKIWIPQTEESFDGIDAARLQTDGTGFGTVSTTVPGPALISFWWKDATNFDLGVETIAYEGQGWQQVQVVGWETDILMKWHSGLFDQLQLESLKNDPFKQWAFNNFPIEEVANDFDAFRTGDSDFDSFSNLIEWALNKDLDFPDEALPYKITEIGGEKYLGLTYFRPVELGEFAIHLQASTDLTTWERIDSVRTELFNPSNNTFLVTIRDIQPMDTGERFIRLVVSDEN